MAYKVVSAMMVPASGDQVAVTNIPSTRSAVVQVSAYSLGPPQGATTPLTPRTKGQIWPRKKS